MPAPTPNSDIRLRLEEGLRDFFITKKLFGSALYGAEIYAGHGETKIEGALVVIITATNKGGKLAYAGVSELDVQWKLIASADDAGMRLLSPLESEVFGYLAPENTAALLQFLNAIPGLGVSCYETDGKGSEEGRDPETREHGAHFTFRFHASLR